MIIPALMRRARDVLATLRDGVQEKVMRLLHRTLGNHNKRCCNDYLSLVYLTQRDQDQLSVPRALPARLPG